MRGASEPELVLAGDERLAFLARLLNLSFELEELMARNQVPFLQNAEGRAVRELRTLH